MTPPSQPDYTIAEAAALTGLHKNTIRMRIKLGQLDAHRAQGKFGEEYRIERAALIKAGLLTPEEPPSTPTVTPPLADPDLLEAPRLDTPPIASQAALLDLLQRHEQSMYRLGWLEAELARHKALAENAESLQQTAWERELEIRELRRDLERAQERNREIEELRNLVREMERETDRMRDEVERHRAAATRRWWHALVGRRAGS
jgi:excisionase family DNA binding protein